MSNEKSVSYQGEPNGAVHFAQYELDSIKAALRTPQGEDPVLHAKAVRELADATIKLAGQ